MFLLTVGLKHPFSGKCMFEYKEYIQKGDDKSVHEVRIWLLDMRQYLRKKTGIVKPKIYINKGKNHE